MIRFGLCCAFREQPLRFRTCTAASLTGVSRNDALARLSALCRENARSLLAALRYCHRQEIGAFRVVSSLLPLRTHPAVGYEIQELPDVEQILAAFDSCRTFAASNDIRTSFHPDQFVVLNSLREDVVKSSLKELEHHGEMCELVGADVINIHAGGVFGNRDSALERLVSNINRLSDRARSRLTLENDDTSYSPVDLLPVCWREQIPLVYDVHHHRCLSDGCAVNEVTDMALTTWNREPLFHMSSPAEGWAGPNPKRHHDYVSLVDFPPEWSDLPITIEIEAKAKELAVLKLMEEVRGEQDKRSPSGRATK